MGTAKTSVGLEENIAGLFCYVLGFVTGIIFLLIEKENKFVRFHAMQSAVTFLSFFVITIVIGFIPVINLLGILLWLLSLILWIVLMIKAYQGQMFKLPVIGDIAENLLERQPLQSSQELEIDTGKQQKKAKFCRNCGNPLKTGDRFCAKCGKQV